MPDGGDPADMRCARLSRLTALAFIGMVAAACGSAEPGPSRPDPSATGEAGWQIVRHETEIDGRLSDLAIYDAETIWVTSSGATDEQDGVGLGRWDGRRWVEVPLPDGFTDAYGIRVDIAAPDDIWVEGGTGDAAEGSGVWRWNGSTWREVDLPGPPGFELHDIATVSSDDVWVFGSVDGRRQTRTYHWDGQQWRNVPFAKADEGGCYEAVEIAAPDDIWAAGFECASNKRQVMAAHWDGKAWTTVLVPKLERLLGVATVGPGEVWALGSLPADKSAILRWNGTSFDTMDTPPLPKELTDIVPDGSGGLWLAVKKGYRVAFVHKNRSGRWTTTPTLTDSGSAIDDIGLIPGTRRLLAVGCENCAFPGPASALFLRYEPARERGAGR